MARHVHGAWLFAGGVAALSCIALVAGYKTVAAQSSDPGEPPIHSLSGGNGPMTPMQQPPALSSEFLAVPLVNNVPGGVQPQSTISNPVANDPSAPERGMRYFESFNCVGCHAPNGAGGMGPSLSDAAFKFGAKPAQHFLVISHGAPLGMPAWGGVLPENVIWDLVAYIQSISQPPTPEWGTTVSPSADMPGIEQVPAEFKQTATPWQFVEPFANGNAPGEASSGAAASGSSER